MVLKYIQLEVIDEGWSQIPAKPTTKIQAKVTKKSSCKKIEPQRKAFIKKKPKMNGFVITPPNLAPPPPKIPEVMTSVIASPNMPVVTTASAFPSFNLLQNGDYEVPTAETDDRVKLHTDFLHHKHFIANGRIFGGTYRYEELMQHPPGYIIVMLPCTFYIENFGDHNTEYIYLPEGLAFSWSHKKFVAGPKLRDNYEGPFTIYSSKRLFKIPKSYHSPPPVGTVVLSEGYWSLCGSCLTSVNRHQHKCHICGDFMIQRDNSTFKYVLFPDFSSHAYMVVLQNGETFSHAGGVYTAGESILRCFMGFKVYNAVELVPPKKHVY